MTDDRLETLLHRIRELAQTDRVEDCGPRSVTFTLRCRVLPPSPWSPQEMERGLGIKLPEDLASLWDRTAGLRLFEDITYGQWGLVLWDPAEVLRRNGGDAPEIAYRQEDFRQGDLLIGGFLGDADSLLARCDADAKDFGSLLVSLPTVSRKEWPEVGRSLLEFLERYLDASGEKFWSKR